VIKTLLKLAIVAIVANATWHVWGAYAAHFKFKDAVQSASRSPCCAPASKARA